MMLNGAMGRHVISGRCLPPSPLPGIGTVLSPRGEDLAPSSPIHWPPPPPPSVAPFDSVDGPLLFGVGDFLCPPNGFLLETWENSRKGEEYLGVGNNLSAEEGRCKVERSASALNISIDPVGWTREDALKWLRHVMRLNHSSPGLIAEEDWAEDGKGLCEMTVEEFNRRLPIDGQLLHSELELWKTVFEVQIMSGYNSVPSSSLGFFGEDFWRDPAFVSSPIYANLETAEAAGNTYLPHQVDHQKYMTTPPSLLHTDPNLQQVSVGYEQPTVGSKIDTYYEYNNNNNNNNDNCYNCNNNNSTIVVKAEQLDDDQSNADDSSWAMDSHSEAMLPSKSQHLHHKPRLQQQQQPKWPVTRPVESFAGVTAGVMPDVVPSVVHRRGKRTITLWQFLKELLYTSFPDPAPIRWIDRNEGVFKIEDSVRVARLWGERKNRPTMNYDKLSRSIRQYYKKGVIKKTTNSKRLVYQFCPRFM